MSGIVLAKVLPRRTELAPWTDKKGRFDRVRALVFAGLLVPAVWLAARWLGGMLGPEPVNAAIHSTGYAAVWLLLASLVVTPFRAVSGWPSVTVLRRMVGNAALLYALLHLVLYMVDQKWRMGTIVLEIVKRFYLTIGFVGLVGLLVLGLTSTDGWAQALGRRWKRLHRVVYALTVLGLVHYILQSKLDVSQALEAVGVFAWLMLWRVLPAGRDRTWLPLLGTAVAAGLVTLAAEYLWYRFGTRIDPWKVVAGEADIAFGLHPAGEVLVVGLEVAAVVLLRQVGQSRFGGTVGFTMLVYGLGAFADDLGALLTGQPIEDAGPAGLGPLGMDLVWVGLLALLGVGRWLVRGHWARHWLDAVWVVCVLHSLVLWGSGNRSVVAPVVALVVGFAIVVGQRFWAAGPVREGRRGWPGRARP